MAALAAKSIPAAAGPGEERNRERHHGELKGWNILSRTRWAEGLAVLNEPKGRRNQEHAGGDFEAGQRDLEVVEHAGPRHRENGQDQESDTVTRQRDHKLLAPVEAVREQMVDQQAADRVNDREKCHDDPDEIIDLHKRTSFQPSSPSSF